MVRGQTVVVVDDIVNTGHSLRQTIEALRGAKADVIGAAAWVTRGNVAAEDLGVEHFQWLAEVRIPTWPGSDCELCRRGVPVNTRCAHGAEYVASETRVSR